MYIMEETDQWTGVDPWDDISSFDFADIWPVLRGNHFLWSLMAISPSSLRPLPLLP